jgi:hypothetical protein
VRRARKSRLSAKDLADLNVSPDLVRRVIRPDAKVRRDDPKKRQM